MLPVAMAVAQYSSNVTGISYSAFVDSKSIFSIMGHMECGILNIDISAVMTPVVKNS